MIVTVTMNPAIDISGAVDEIGPFRKLRLTEVRRDPGGGGINVARVVRRYGEAVTAIYPSGGTIGRLLQQLVGAEGVSSRAIPVAQDTREDFTAFERKSGLEYRFVMPGPHLSEAEWRQCLDAAREAPDTPSYFIISGSLPPGVPDDFYVRLAEVAHSRGAKIAVDTSGRPLRALLTAGVDLVTPNRRELQEFVGRPLEDEPSQLAAAREVVERGHAAVVALTLGDRGGLLINREGAWRAATPRVKPVSTVGAGDSFLAALVVQLDRGLGIVEAFRHGIAAGTSALMSPGTDLCRPDEAARLLPQIKIESLGAMA